MSFARLGFWSLLMLLSLSSCEELLTEAILEGDRNRQNTSTTATTTTTRPSTTSNTDLNNTGPGRLNGFEPTQLLGDVLVKHKYYTASYSSKHKSPEWVAYELTQARVEAPGVPRRSNFISDPANPQAAKNSDYNNTGWDRGHLAAAEDMGFNDEAMEQSFYMTNVTPQDPTHNRGIWRTLEDRTRRWASKDKRLYVITGPILPKRITTATEKVNGIVVPQYMYKVILDYDLPVRKGIAFIIDNKAVDKPLQSFAVPISKVEERTGLTFFPKLSAMEQQELKNKIDLSLWDF